MDSLYFEDLRPYMEFRSAMSRIFTLEAVEAFFTLTGDRVHRPSTGTPDTPGAPGTVMVQGNFIVSVTGGLLFDVGHFTETIFAQARKDTHFRLPLFVGERIYAIERITALSDRPEKPFGKVNLERKTFAEDGRLVLETMQDYRILKRPALAQI